MLCSVWSAFSDNDNTVELIYNDVDVYHGSFGDGAIERKDCTYVKLDGVDKEVNFMACSNLNVEYLIKNCDINVIAVFVRVSVSEKKVSSVEWTVDAQF